MFKTRFISILALLLMAVSGAWAQTERLLTTITPTGNTTYSETIPGAVTVTQNCEYYDSGYGWCFEFNPGSVTVEANEGYTISKCVFTLSNGSTTILTISTPPFKINFVWDDEIGGCYCEGTEKYDIYFGVKSIQVYTNTVDVTGITLDKTEASMIVGGETLTLTPTVAPGNATDKSVTWSSSDEAVATVADGVVTAVAAGTATITVTTTDGAKTATCAVTVAAPAASTYTVTLKESTEDATSWTIAPDEATTTGVAQGTTVTATYAGDLKVKSVKAVKKAAAAPAGTDLSMVDCAGNARDNGMWTANCYMVHTAGNYKLPLVYGNAIKNGAANTEAYTGIENSNTTLTFPRHDGEAIADPWIKNNGITVTTAELLWQDVQGLVTAVDIDGDYLTLTVGTDAAEQEGNAVIAAKDADGTIVWSWHIWVTKQTFATLTEVNTDSHTYQLTPVNLGWVGDATSTTGYCTFYQWGRKDAFIPTTGTANTNHTVYNISNAPVSGFSHTNNSSVTIGGNIQNPTVHNSTTKGPCNTYYYNMWDAQQTSNDENTAAATVKTVYDPCPPGFCVPTSGLYNYIGSQTVPAFNKGCTYNGVFFPASGIRQYGTDYLFYVGTNGYCWSATPYDGTFGRNFRFSSGSWKLDYGNRASGYPVRAVAE